MAPFIFTAPEDIPLHPSAPEYVAQGSEPGDCIATSSFTLIAEHQRVIAAKARSVSRKEKIRDQDKSKNTEIPKSKQVHHPRSKVARTAWVAKNDAERDQDATSTNALVAEHIRLTDIIESTDSQAPFKQLERPSTGTDENVAADEKVAAELHSMPPAPSISSAPLSPSSTRVDAPDVDVVHGSEDERATPSLTDITPATVLAETPATSANTPSPGPISPDTAEKLPLEVPQDPKTGGMAVRWRMIRPAPAPAEETVLQPVSAPVQASASTHKNKPEKTLPGKENSTALASAPVSTAPPRRSQRTLKRKRGENKSLVDRFVDALV